MTKSKFQEVLELPPRPVSRQSRPSSSSNEGPPTPGRFPIDDGPILSQSRDSRKKLSRKSSSYKAPSPLPSPSPAFSGPDADFDFDRRKRAQKIEPENSSAEQVNEKQPDRRSSIVGNTARRKLRKLSIALSSHYRD